MKIGVYSLHNYDKKVGGGYNYFRTIIDALETFSSKHEFVIIVDSESEFSFEQKTKFGTKIISFTRKTTDYPFIWRVLNYISRKLKWKGINAMVSNVYAKLDSIQLKKEQERFEYLISKEKIDMVYYPVPLACFSPNVPFFTTVWDFAHFTKPWFPEITQKGQYATRNDFYTNFLPRASKIIIESEKGREQVTTMYPVPNHKITTIRQFGSYLVDIVVSQDRQVEILNKYNLEKGKFIFYPAQMWSHKNHYNLLMAMSELKERGHHFDIVFTGADYGNEAYIREIAEELNLVNEYKYLGFVDEDEIVTFYKNAFALTYASLAGPTNIPIVEGLALKCPVICHHLEGHQEQGNEYATYIDGSKPEEWIDAIEEMIQNPNDTTKKVEDGYHYYINSDLRIEKAIVKLIDAFDEFEGYRKCWR